MTPHAAATARGLLTAEQAGQLCGLTKRVILRMVKRRQIQCYRFNGRVLRFKHSDVEKFIERARV